MASYQKALTKLVIQREELFAIIKGKYISEVIKDSKIFRGETIF